MEEGWRKKTKVHVPGFNNKWHIYHILFVSVCLRMGSLLPVRRF